MSEGRKILLESEPSSILLARSAPQIAKIANASAATTDHVLEEGDKAFYGPSYGIIQNIQDIRGFQGFSFCSKKLYFVENLPCSFDDFANSSSISLRIAMS